MTEDLVNDEDRRFYAQLSGNDPLSIVILSVAYIDVEVTGLLDTVVVNPKALRDVQLDYHGKIALAVALGFDPRFRTPLNALGKIRNKFAHQTDAALTETDAGNLFKALHSDEKQMVQVHYERLRARFEGETPRPKRFKDLSPLDQFVLIAITLRGALKVTRMHAAADAENQGG